MSKVVWLAAGASLRMSGVSLVTQSKGSIGPVFDKMSQSLLTNKKQGNIA
jgi:hypothetical protein